MDALRIVLTVLFIIVCVLLVVVVLMQEGKQQGLGSIGGASESYWGRNKGRSMEGRSMEGFLPKITKLLAFLFLVLAAVLNLKMFS